MATKELVKILEAHKLWCHGDSKGKCADLRGADLSDADLRGANLRGADLRDADLRGAYLNYTNLRDSNLRDADLLPNMYILKLQPPKTVLRAWKYLKNGKSPYQSASYKAKKIYTEKDFSQDERIICDKGLNVATLQWCIRDSSIANEFIEVEFYAKDIVAIPFATDGKFRVKRFKVLRQIDRKKATSILDKFLDPYKKKE